MGEVSDLFPTVRQNQVWNFVYRSYLIQNGDEVDVCQWYAPNSCCYLVPDASVPIDLDFARHVEVSLEKIDGEYCSELFHQAFCSVCRASQGGIEKTGATGTTLVDYLLTSRP